jgi:hypothetical protein
MQERLLRFRGHDLKEHSMPDDSTLYRSNDQTYSYDDLRDNAEAEAAGVPPEQRLRGR